MDTTKRAFVLIGLSIAGIIYFWLYSRFPDLDAKALMASTASVSDTLSPWPLFTVNPNDPFYSKVFFSTLNWINSNLKGMAFGISLGAAFLTLFSYIKLPEQNGSFRNTFYGFLLGTPLSVCVNCAAPVFKGILESKRIELAMATMLSSPTMNIIVLTMVFTLFPFYMGIVKILFTLICIFVAIPLIAKILKNKPANESEKNNTSISDHWFLRTPEANCVIARNENWFQASYGAISDFSSKLKFMSLRMIPLMIIAGFLGSFFSHLLPASIFESDINFFTIIVASLFGVLLPIPIAFDVILVNAFYAQGLAEPIVLVLLCTLGIISLFSFMVIWSSVSRQWAISMLAFCFSLSLVVGVSADHLHQQYYVKPKFDEFSHLQKETTTTQRNNIQTIDASSIKPRSINKNSSSTSSSRAEKIIFTTLKDNSEVKISSSPFNKSLQATNNQFKKMEGYEIGLNKGFKYGIRDYTDPFWIGRGTASGDFNKDGWPDIIFGSNNGFVLYKNIGGKFQIQTHSNTVLNDYQVFAVAFIDLDNNGWLDIFFTTFDYGNFVIYNSNGDFDYNNPVSIPNQNALLTISPAFADLDANGLLDIVNGNMALGVITGSHHLQNNSKSNSQNNPQNTSRRNNSIVFNGGNTFRDVPLETSSGETMSTLISDINNDGMPDIYFSNDFIVPDKILLGSGNGFKQVKTQNLIPYTPFFSMSADSGDINNDLTLDLLTTGTTATASHIGSGIIDGIPPEEYSSLKVDADTCNSIKDRAYREHCINVRKSNYINILDEKRNIDFEKCKQLSNQTRQQSCLLAVMWHMVTQNPNIKNCKSHFKQDRRLQTACETLKTQGDRYNKTDLANAIPQNDKNYLYSFSKDKNAFSPVNRFNHPGGWTWNSKIADLDNDGFQDIINAEGAVRKSGYGWNVLMKNIDGKTFEQKQFSLGLNSDFGLFSFSLIDMDNDGDLDIIGNSAEGPVQVYQNNLNPNNNSISFNLIDQRGNRNAIGAKIYIYYDNGSKAQMREIKASGGYMSFESSTTHFGLGQYHQIDRVKIEWPDKSIEFYSGPFPASHHYEIVRK